MGTAGVCGMVMGQISMDTTGVTCLVIRKLRTDKRVRSGFFVGRLERNRLICDQAR